MQEISYFTLAAVLLYFVSDWILNQIEKSKGERLPNRSFVFSWHITYFNYSIYLFYA